MSLAGALWRVSVAALLGFSAFALERALDRGPLSPEEHRRLQTLLAPSLAP